MNYYLLDKLLFFDLFFPVVLPGDETGSGVGMGAEFGSDPCEAVRAKLSFTADG